MQPEPLPLPVTQTAPLVTLPVQQSQASVRSSEPLVALPAGEITPGTIAPPVDLAPGETVVQMIAAPTIVRVPAVQPVTALTPAPIIAESVTRQPVIDPVTGRPRDTPGWTGSTAAPEGVGCFPAGSCATLGN